MYVLTITPHFNSIKIYLPSPVWLSWLGVAMQSKMSPVGFPVREHAGLHVRSPVGACKRQ